MDIKEVNPLNGILQNSQINIEDIESLGDK